MVREDIITGLRNAVERGYSLQQAKQSFLNAGYSQRDVEEAAQFVGSEIFINLQPQKIEKEQTEISEISTNISGLEQKKEKAGIFVIVLLIIILVILLALLGVVFFYREKFIEFLQGLFV